MLPHHSIHHRLSHVYVRPHTQRCPSLSLCLPALLFGKIVVCLALTNKQGYVVRIPPLRNTLFELPHNSIFIMAAEETEDFLHGRLFQ
jgi:hypothetical protein